MKKKLNINKLKKLVQDIVKGNYVEVVKALHENNTPGRCTSEFWNYSPLSLACKLGHMKLVRFLHKDDIYLRQDDTVLPPLHAAILGGHLEVVEFLINEGADINEIRTNCFHPPNHLEHFSPLALACWLKHFEIAELLINNNASIGSLLLANDNINVTYGNTLTLLIDYEKKELFSKALKKANGSELFAPHKGIFRVIPLVEYAIIHEQIWALPILLEKYADHNIPVDSFIPSKIIIMAFQQGLSKPIVSYINKKQLDRTEDNGKTVRENTEQIYPDFCTQ